MRSLVIEADAGVSRHLPSLNTVAGRGIMLSRSSINVVSLPRLVGSNEDPRRLLARSGGAHRRWLRPEFEGKPTCQAQRRMRL
jgi:hypothetical protein